MKSSRVSLSEASCARAAYSAAFCQQYPICSRIRVSSPVQVVELSFGEANSPKTNRVKSCPTIGFPFAPCQIARCRAIGLSICPMNGPAQRANQRESEIPRLKPNGLPRVLLVRKDEVVAYER